MKQPMLRLCTAAGFDSIDALINEAADAYRGVIPTDCWREPYVSQEDLRHEIESDV
jgi:hypothetical protein